MVFYDQCADVVRVCVGEECICDVVRVCKHFWNPPSLFNACSMFYSVVLHLLYNYVCEVGVPVTQ